MDKTRREQLLRELWYESWRWEARKWEKIIEKVRKGERFADRYPGEGFADLDVMCAGDYSGSLIARSFGFRERLKTGLESGWGYCKRFKCYGHFHGAPDCPLFLRKVDGIRVCFYFSDPPSHFWRFIEEMRKKEVSQEIALKEAEIIYQAVLDSCPDIKRAEKEDGINFNINL